MSEYRKSKINPNDLSDESLSIGSIETIKADIRRRWEAALKTEGFGYQNTSDNNINVSNEIESLFDFKKMMVWVTSSDYDRKCRMLLVANYVKPYFSNKSLNRSVIPHDSFIPDILNSTAILYKDSPRRYVDDNDANNLLQSIYSQSYIDSKFLEIHKLLKYTKTVAVKVVRRIVDDENIIDLDIYDPSHFRVLLNSENEVIKILYEGEIFHEYGSKEEVIFVYTKDSFYYVDVLGDRHAYPGNPDMKNPYGRIPFVLMELHDGGLFENADFDLTTRVLNYNMYKLLSDNDAVVSTRHLTFLTNIDIPQNRIVSSQDVFLTEAVNKDETPNAQIVSGQEHYPTLKDLYKDEYRTAALERGVPAFTIDNSFRELNSGKALKIQMKKIIDSTKIDSIKMRKYEKNLAKLIAIVANIEYEAERYTTINKLIDISKLNTFRVDYKDTFFDDGSEAEIYRLRKEQMIDGVLSIADFVRLVNDDITSNEEALQYFKDNKEKLEEFEDAGFLTQLTLTTDNTNE